MLRLQTMTGQKKLVESNRTILQSRVPPWKLRRGRQSKSLAVAVDSYQTVHLQEPECCRTMKELSSPELRQKAKESR